MATSSPKPDGLKPSFASVAARAVPNRNGPTIIGHENRPPTIPSSTSPTRSSRLSTADSPSASHSQGDLQSSMAQLDVRDAPPASKTLDEQARSNIKRAGLRLDDDQTQTSSSSTKPSSLDGKSTASGTTFAFDEKESLRPDDSASVQAVDDDDIGSGAASGAPNSRMGSEAGSRAFRDQFNEVTENVPTGVHRSHPLSRRVITDIEEEGPQMTPLNHVASVPAQILVNPGNPTLRPTINFEYQEPDEKLFEALDSPKDRMFLLRLEQDIIDFIKNSVDPQIHLPPCNSFCRLLAHKLADYYALTHFVDNAQSAVTLYRTPYCRIRTPLGLLAKAHGQDTCGAMPVNQPAMKIMRRPGLGRDGQSRDSGPATTESSVVPSKAGSEVGDDSQQGTGAASPTESTLAKDKAAMSRAEREARYKEKREQIFGPEGENADSTEALNEMSRSSSRNEEKKRKKKQKNNNDEFEARSQFNAYYPAMQYAVNSYDQNAVSASYYNPYNMPATPPQAGQPNYLGSGLTQQPYQSSFQTTLPVQGFPVMMPQNNVANAFSPQSFSQSYEQQTPTPYFAVIQPPIAMAQPPPNMPPTALDGGTNLSRPQPQMHDQQLSHNGYNYSYQQQSHPQNQQQHQQYYSHAIPYQFGQLPFQPSMQNGKLAHPLPGSYTRPQAFNPQTRSFVPNNVAAHPQSSPLSQSPTQSGARSPSLSLPSNGQYSQIPTHLPMPISAQSANQNHKGNSSRKSTIHTNGAHSPVQSSLSKWGTPANLPPKPPPPEVPSMPDSLPTNNQFFSTNIQTLSAGQSMPHYQNGVYTRSGQQ